MSIPPPQAPPLALARASGHHGCMALQTSDSSQSPIDILRRLENLIRLGTVAQVRHEGPPRCRVKSGNLLTDWLPWMTSRAGADSTWWAPEVGEQVIVLSPGGNVGAGVVLPALNSDHHPAPGKSGDVARFAFADGTVIEYDRAVHVLHVSGPHLIKLRASGQVQLDGDVYVRGDLHVTGSIRADRRIMGAQGVWPMRPLQVPRMAPSNADAGIHP